MSMTTTTPRTSRTDPLRIATVPVPGCRGGLLGLTLCPGKRDPAALTGAWARDLAADLEAVRAWGAAAVVTLMEDHELTRLSVANLGEAAEALGLAWVHLPIRDVSVPDAAFEGRWRIEGAMVRDLLRAGRRVLLHCRGDLGRTGTVAARLLVELGMDPEAAIRAIRAARPGAIETSAQEAHVRARRPVAAAPPGITAEARAVGALLGLAVGDALGTTLEFSARDSHPPLDDMVGGGPFGLRPGRWTDDTSMALCLADSLLARGALDRRDLMERFVRWWRHGERSVTGECFDIGGTTKAALRRFVDSGEPVSGSRDPRAAGNGSLMRLAPVAIRWHADPMAAAEAARAQSEVTHGAAEAVEACALFAGLLVETINGAPKGVLLLPPRAVKASPALAAIGRGGWRRKGRGAIRSSGYVVDTLEAALWCAYRATDFREAVLLAANLGDDADTVTAVTGQLAGAIWGEAGIPPAWRARLAWGDEIAALARALFAAGRPETETMAPRAG